MWHRLSILHSLTGDYCNMGRIPSVQNVSTIIEKDLLQKVLSTCKMERIFLIPAERDQILKNL